MLNANQFWGVIDDSRACAGTNDREFLNLVSTSLRKLAPDQIVSFEKTPHGLSKKSVSVKPVGRSIHYQWRLFR